MTRSTCPECGAEVVDDYTARKRANEAQALANLRAYRGLRLSDASAAKADAATYPAGHPEGCDKGIDQ